MRNVENLLRLVIRESVSRPKIYVLVGPPAIGKGWWVDQNLVDPYVISRDNIVDAIRGPEGLKYDEMFGPLGKRFLGDIDEHLRDRIKGALGSGKDIVVDMTNMNAFARRRALGAIAGRESEYEKIAVFFDFRGLEDLVLKSVEMRAQKLGDKNISPDVIRGMMNRFEMPTRSEGFDEIIDVDPMETLTRSS